MMAIDTTLNEIREYEPCPKGWNRLLAYLGKTSADDEPLSYATILEGNGLKDAIWALRTRPDLHQIALFAADCAESVLHVFERDHPDDDRPRKAIEAARVYGANISVDTALSAVSAADAAFTAEDADVGGESSASAASAAYAAEAAAFAYVAYAAAVDDHIYVDIAATADGDVAAHAAADAANDAATHAAFASDSDTEREKQKQLFLKHFGEG